MHVEDTCGQPLTSTGGLSVPTSDVGPCVDTCDSVGSSDFSTGPSNLLSALDNKMLKSESVISLSSRLSVSNSPVKQLDRPSVINLSTIPLPSNLATELVGEVRRHTDLSYDKSCLAVEVVLTHIANKMPQTAGLMEKILCTFQEVRIPRVHSVKSGSNSEMQDLFNHSHTQTPHSLDEIINDEGTL